MMRYREPVLGTRDDLLPPHGMFTVELYDPDTGHVAHRVTAENTILDHSLRISDQKIRRHWSRGQVGAIGTDQDYWWMQLGTLPKEGPSWWGLEFQQRWIYMSDSSLAVNSAEWAIPGNIIGGALQGQNASGSGVRRGDSTPSQMIRDRYKRRYTADFTQTQAQGTINSFGMGSLIHNTSADVMYPLPGFVPYTQGVGPAMNAYGSENDLSERATQGSFDGFGWTGTQVNFSAMWLADNGSAFWYALGGIGLFKRDIGLSNTQPYAQAVTITGPTYTTVGAAIGDSIGIAFISTDMWLGYATTLKKCAIPTDGTLSVTTTYAAVSGFTDAAILDVTTDGTNLYLLGSTKVFVVNPATGAVTSSWTHSLTNVKSLEYTAAPIPYLYICYDVTTFAAMSWYANTGGGQSHQFLVRSFTTAGVLGPYLFGNQNVDFQAAFTSYQWTGSFAGGWGALSARGNTSFGAIFRAPGLMSRAVLGTPIVHDSTKALRVIYDISFT